VAAGRRRFLIMRSYMTAFLLHALDTQELSYTEKGGQLLLRYINITSAQNILIVLCSIPFSLLIFS
jgi:hypothetical protein